MISIWCRHIVIGVGLEFSSTKNGDYEKYISSFMIDLIVFEFNWFINALDYKTAV